MEIQEKARAQRMVICLIEEKITKNSRFCRNTQEEYSFRQDISLYILYHLLSTCQALWQALNVCNTMSKIIDYQGILVRSEDF